MSRALSLTLILLTSTALFVAAFVLNRSLGLLGNGYDYVVRFDLPSADAPVDLPAVEGPADSSRPLVVIDPGHGGFDPGAGHGNLKEKDVALRISRAIRDDLLKGGGIRVAMTRDLDRFIALTDRPEIARRLGADIFISIHADSAEVDSARGASVYVLSERGSSQAAERIVARENGAIRVNGVLLRQNSGTVGAILLDLSQRKAQAGSTQLAELILRELNGKVMLRRDEVQTGALAVLKAPDIPSALVETGYINNPEDFALLTSRAGRDRIASATAQAIRAYLARNPGT